MDKQEFRTRFGPWAVVAGASEGLGQAYAASLASMGLNLLMIARRGDILQREADALQSRFGIEARPLVLDLAAEDLAQAFAAAVAHLDIGLLVYDACYTNIAPFAEATLQQHLTAVDVNCRGPLVLCHALVPKLLARGRGGIVLMSSMSGQQGSALISSYAASKAFNTVLAQSLWEELRGSGVHALGCIGGAIDTPAYRRNTPQAKQAKAFPLSPEAVADETLKALARGKGPIIIPGRINRTVHAIARLFSSGQRTRFFSKATRDLYG